MRPLPTPPAPGKPVSATLIRQLIDAIRERTVLPGRNTSVKRGPNGTVVDLVKEATTGRHQDIDGYWVFSCSEDENSHERSGGWRNCRMQIGFRCLKDEDNWITGRDNTEDGRYYAQVDLITEKAELVVVKGDSPFPPFDETSGKVNIYVGCVEDGKMIDTIDCIPVVYKYL